MATKKTITPAPTPTRTGSATRTVKKDNVITATHTDADPTHEQDPADTSTHDDSVDSVLAGIAASRSDALTRAIGTETSPDDDPTGGRGKTGKSAVEGNTDAGPEDGGQTTTTRLPAGGVVVTDKDEGVRSTGKAPKDDGSELSRIGTLIGSGGPAGPAHDGIRQAIAEQNTLVSKAPDTSTPPQDTTTTTRSGATKITKPDGTVIISSGDIRTEKKPDGTTTVVDAHNNTETTTRPDGSSTTRDANTGKVIDTTPKLQDPPPRDAKGNNASSEPEDDDDDGPGEPDDSADPANDGQSLVDDNDGQSTEPGTDPDDPNDGQSLVPDDELPADPDDDPNGQSIDPDSDPNGQSIDPELDPNGQSVEPDPAPDPADDPNGQSVEPDPAPDPADDPNGQSVEPDPAPDPADDPNGQSVEPDPAPDPADDPNGQSTEPADDPNGQSTEPADDPNGQSSLESQSGDPGGGDPGDGDGGGSTLPPDISSAIQADIARLRTLKPSAGNGFTDPGPDDDGSQAAADTRVSTIPDVHNQIIGGDTFDRDAATPHPSGDVSLPTGPGATNPGAVDPGPDDVGDIQTSGREQDPFDRGPQLKPIVSSTTSDDSDDGDDSDDDDDDGSTVGSPLFATTAVRQFQFDHVPSLASDDDDPDDD